MLTLALDVDGVLLDPDRGGAGPWKLELERRHGVPHEQLREQFFQRAWGDVVNGRRPLEPALQEALERMSVSVDVEAVIDCWFEADFVPFETAIGLATRAAAAGVRIVLATNQEHRRAAYLDRHLGERFPIDAVLYSAALGVQKHDSVFFERASERLDLGADRSSVVFVDDAESNVRVAREAGWRAIHAAPGVDWTVEVGDILGLDG